MGKKLRNIFLLALLVILPIAATILITVWIFTSIDNLLKPLIKSAWDINILGLGFIILIIVILLTGLIVSKFGVNYGKCLMGKIPLIGAIYNSVKQISDSFLKPGHSNFKQVVVVEFPMKETRTLGFITNESTGEDGEKLLYVFIPTAPNPTSGFFRLSGKRTQKGLICRSAKR